MTKTFQLDYELMFDVYLFTSLNVYGINRETACSVI